MTKIGHRALLLALYIFSVASCVKDECLENEDKSISCIGNTEFVLREANPSNVVTEGAFSEDEAIATKSSGDISGFLGRTYKTKHYPLADKENLGMLAVIDLNSYINDHPDSYIEESYNKIENKSRVFTSLEEDSFFNNDKDVFSIGGKINIGLVKASIKQTLETVFNEKSTSQHKLAYAEFFNQWRHKGYHLDLYANNNLDMLDYLTKSFLDRLHDRSPKSFIDQYGAFFLSRYETGSRATVLYEGEYSNKYNYTYEQSKRVFESKINATLGKMWKVDAGLTYSHENNSSTTRKNIFNKYKYWTSAFNSTIGPDSAEISHELGNTVFDFTNWYDSLKDTTNFHIVRIPEKSLVPLTDFIEESNIKRQFEDFYAARSLPEKLQTPKIVINSIERDGGYDVSVDLITRYGDDKNYLAEGVFVEKKKIGEYYSELYKRLVPIFPNLAIVCNGNNIYSGIKPKYYVEIEVTRLYGTTDRINTYIGNLPDGGILLRSVELTNRFVSDYLIIEEARINRIYPNAKVSITDLDGDFPLTPRGYTIDDMTSLKILVDIVIPSYYYKYVDSKTGRIYIIDRDTMTAYCLYNRTIVRNYFSDRFIEMLPVSKIKSLDEIRKHYNIIAL